MRSGKKDGIHAQIKIVEKHCEICNGIMRPTGKVSKLRTLKYEHRCMKCGREVIYDTVYPELQEVIEE